MIKEIVLLAIFVIFGISMVWYWAGMPLVAIDSSGKCAWVEIKGERMSCEHIPKKYETIRVK